MIFLVYKKWNSKVIPKSINFGWENGMCILLRHMKLQILLQQTRLLSNPCNIRYIQQRKLVYATKNNLWKSQKEPGYFVVEGMHKYLDHGRNCLKEKKMYNWNEKLDGVLSTSRQ
jgi:hypothetical protein